MAPLLNVSDLKVILNNNVIFDNINFSIKERETLAIIGPNGAGKTTLFHALLGLIPYKGKIEWKKGIKIGYVPQRINIDKDLPLTTMDFFKLKNASNDEINFVLSAVGFEKNKPHKNHLDDHILNGKIGVLSGGEFQRVMIAWALIGNPDILLFDEPTSGVDISAGETIYGLLRRLQTNQKLAILLISHDLNIVYKYANNVLCLNKNQICYGPPNQKLNQETLNKLYGNNIGIYEHH